MQDTLVSLTEDEKKLKQIVQHVLMESGILSIPPYDRNGKYNIKSEVEWNTWCSRYVLRNFRKEVLQNGSNGSGPSKKSNSKNSRGKLPSKQDS
ncbi:MAG TPA: hypothetical protein VJN71_04425 [Nitrososphaerales archaeon]|nr:hypothetical protein [Nitrososphaerales archaeon]